MVLARVPKGRIAERGAYEFFKGPARRRYAALDRGHRRTRGGLRVIRGDVTARRQLRRRAEAIPLVPDLAGGDARFRGGFGIYDAPEPWGPWTTVFLTEDWDVGPGETCSFPTNG